MHTASEVVVSGAVSEKIRRVYLELDRLLAAAGHGAIKRTLTAAGVGPSYLRDLRRRLGAGQETGYDLGVLLRILEVLEVDDRLFFGRVLGSAGAVESQRLALEHLDEDEHRNRFSALQGLALYHCELGDQEKAREFALLAAELSSHVGSWLGSKLLRLQARIAIAQRQYAQAESYLREALDLVMQISPGEAALATTELARALVLQRRGDEAEEVARSMTRFIDPLEDRSPVSAAAVLELVLCGQAGRGLTVERIDQVASVLEEERARPRKRARSKR